MLNPYTNSKLCLVVAVLLFCVTTELGWAQHSSRRQCGVPDCYPPHMAPLAPSPLTPSEPIPSDPTDPMEPTEPTLPEVEPSIPEAPEPEIDLSPEVSSGGFGLASAPQSALPNTIGDFFYRSGFIDDASGDGASFGPGGGPRFKIAEQNSGIPDDRVFFLFNHFENAIITDSNRGIESFDVQRYSFGGEKTFLDEALSVEVRVPFLVSQQVGTDGEGVDGNGLGNITINLKGLLYTNDWLQVATGTGVTLPTGEDFSSQVGSDFYTLETEAVHVLPFLFAATRPNDRLFVQGAAQLDFAVSGNTLRSSNLGRIGVIEDQHFLYLDASAGYWVYRNRCARVLTGVAPIIELHYSTTLNDADVVRAGAGGPNDSAVGNFANRVDILNLTAGLHFEAFNRTTITVAGVAPLSDEEDPILGGDQPFDAEVLVQINHRF